MNNDLYCWSLKNYFPWKPSACPLYYCFPLSHNHWEVINDKVHYKMRKMRCPAASGTFFREKLLLTSHNSFCVIWPLTSHNSFCVIWPLTSHNFFCVIWPLTSHNSFCVIWPLTSGTVFSKRQPLTSGTLFRKRKLAFFSVGYGP
jgi:hypothetical protein